MSFTYSGDPSKSVVDAARFLIGDTNDKAPIMQNEEIQYIIDTYGSGKLTNNVKFQLFDRAATLFARDIKRSLGPQSEDPTDRLNFFKEQATYYKGLVAAGGVSAAPYAYPKIFRKGMMSNPRWPKPGGDGYVR
jgi:hypothetical protein